MSRQLRIEYPGAVYHVTSRGNARQAIFIDNDDREVFLRVLEATIGRYHWRCHAYCLMGNHYHLLIETPEANLSRGMRQLNGVYTQTFNRRHGSVGHLFQGRYKSILVDKDTYLLNLCRYIVQNPVAAGLTSTPSDWPWSSYLATAGLVPVPDWLSVIWLRAQFSENDDQARVLYREFVEQNQISFNPWDALSCRTILGAEEFAKALEPLLRDKESQPEIPKPQRLAMRPTLREVLKPENISNRQAQDAAVYRAYVDYGYAMKEIAEVLGVHYATVSRAMKRAERKMCECKT
ncbi:transposase [Desulfuromonas sp. DDH964]|uniref:REP-associated tyrosine transposase n=1 Tax=Desulfuromonas sp. DDH964 TaxID=1823759 RepID=UPI00078C18B6|nr:transposase [Desulfuromonas sp. DDH964]AMV73352.1 transposase [Desulfuromonas sp. DDH964]